MTQTNFKFISEAAGGSQFTVLSFSASEAISSLYQYTIEVRAPLASAINLDDALDNPARFITQSDGVEYPVYGVLASIDEVKTVQDYVHYRIVMVPRLWWLSLYKTNEIYTEEKTVDIIIQTVLENAGLSSGTDFDLTGLITTQLLKRHYRCQFGESDFDFISRLMQNEGIFYYFDHSNGIAEKIIFIHDMSYPRMAKPELVFDISNQSRREYDTINAWSCRKKRLPAGVTVRDFNPDHPSLDISDSAAIDQMGQGTEYIYGENVFDENEASYLSEIRAQEQYCTKTRYYAESTVPRLQPGYLFSLEHHPNERYNSVDYLTVELNHEGLHLDMALSANSDDKIQTTPYYRNSLVAIESTEQFRPARTTLKPRFYGTMTAFIYAETGLNKAEIDEFGRYRVLMPFDRADGTKESSDPNRKSSTWIRMAQNYVGEGKGSYFPLTGGTEVLLSFVNGDPDQPIIIGAVPNASEPSLKTTDNQTESLVQTGSGNKIRMGDVEGEDRIVMESPTASSWLRIGTPNDPPSPDPFDVVTEQGDASDGIKICTAGDMSLVAGGNLSETITGTSVQTVSGNVTQTKQGGSTQNVTGDYILHAQKGKTNAIKFELTDAKMVIDTGGRDFEIKCEHFDVDNASEDNVTSGHDYAKHSGSSHEEFYGNKFEWTFASVESIHVGHSVEVFAGFKEEFSLANSFEFFLGLTQEIKIAPLNLELIFAPTIKYEYAPELKFGGPLGLHKKPEVDIDKAVLDIQQLQSDISSTNLVLKEVGAEVGSAKLTLISDGLRIYT